MFLENEIELFRLNFFEKYRKQFLVNFHQHISIRIIDIKDRGRMKILKQKNIAFLFYLRDLTTNLYKLIFRTTSYEWGWHEKLKYHFLLFLILSKSVKGYSHFFLFLSPISRVFTERTLNCVKTVHDSTIMTR